MNHWVWWINPFTGFVAGFTITYVLKKIIKAHRARKREEQSWHIVDTPVHDPDTHELLGWVSTRSDTGEFLELWGQKKNLNRETPSRSASSDQQPADHDPHESGDRLNMTTRDDQHMSTVWDHRAAIKRLEALAAAVPGRSEAIEPFVQYHRDALKHLEAAADVHTMHVTTGQQAESSAFWPDAKEESYPGGREVRIDPPYDR